MYIYESPSWPNFVFDKNIILGLLSDIKQKQKLLLLKMSSIGFDLHDNALLHILTEEVSKTSAIEGETLNSKQIRSSIAHRLGMDIERPVASSQHVDGVVDMVLDAVRNYNTPLTKERLFGWHSAMFHTGFSGIYRIATGQYRDSAAGNMQVVSGALGKEKAHFQAPAADVLDNEMDRLITYINSKDCAVDDVVKAGIVHLWFVTIHPFEDGNGRIGRALSDMLLARSEQSSSRFYSMSSQIKSVRNGYYDSLEKAQKGNLDITDWLVWFLNTLSKAIDNSGMLLKSVFRKAKFWQKYYNIQINDRQRKMLNKLLANCSGYITSSKYANLCCCSQDTATRDISDMIEKGIMGKFGDGRSTKYKILS